MATDAAPGGSGLVSWSLPLDPSKPDSLQTMPDAFPVHAMYAHPNGSMIPTEGPATEPNGPRTYTYIAAPNSIAFTISATNDRPPQMAPPEPASVSEHPQPLDPSAEPPRASSQSPDAASGVGANHYPSSTGVPRLPPIMQVEKQQVTTSATQVASANRRRNEANFLCPVPGCGSTFTRRFNLRGHLRSHTEERPYVCQWPGCKKGFARQHDCKRHQALHSAKAQANVCSGCKKTFSRLDALNRHLRSDGGAECKRIHDATGGHPEKEEDIKQEAQSSGQAMNIVNESS